MAVLSDPRTWKRALAAAVLAAAALFAAPAAAQTTVTIGDGSNPSSPASPVCPRDNGTPATAATDVDGFTLRGSAAVQVGRVEVRLSPADAYLNVERVVIRDGGGVVLGTYAPGPLGSGVYQISLTTPISVTTGDVNYFIGVVPKQQQDMPPTSVGKAIAVQAVLTRVIQNGVTSTGADTASATVTIDNGSPANVDWEAISATGNNVTLDWAATPNVVVLRRAFGPVENVPVEGATYAANTDYGTSRVVYSATGASFADNGLAANPWYYRVFTRDTCGNFSSGVALGPIYANGTGEGDLTVNSTKPVVGIVSPGSGPATRPFKVQIRVWSPGGAAITEVRLYGNNGSGDQQLATSVGAGAAITKNTNYDATYGAGTASGLYEFTAPASFATGTWTLRAWASNSGTGQATTAGVFSGGVGVNVGTTVGDGKLLVRDNSSQLCVDCHKVKTHSSEATGMGLGSWYVGCRTCHDPHGTTNAKLIATQITPPSVNGAQPPQTVFYTGADGNADGAKANATGTGLCQVCHTRTDFYRRNVANETHGNGAACGTCHSHTEGQRAQCSSCHGDPNRVAVAGADALVVAAPPSAAAPIGTNDVGFHQQHVNQATYRNTPIRCGECHTIPNNHNGATDMLSFIGTASIGTTPIWNPGAATCSSVYCHGQSDTNPLGGDIASWNWTTPTTLTCQSCHGSPPTTTISDGSTHPNDPVCGTCHGAGYALTGITGEARNTHINGFLEASNCTGCHGTEGVNAAPPVAAAPVGANNVGAHQKHLTGTTYTATSLACADCHAQFPANHNNSSQNVVFGDLAKTNGMSPNYLGSTNPATPTCSATYCHAGAAGGTAQTPSWLASGLTCTSCHGLPVPYPHVRNTACGDCHTNYSSTVVVKSTHIDGSVTKRTSGACTACHGTLGMAGVTLVANTNSAAPGFDASGSEDTVGGVTSTSAGVGAHRKHLASATIRPGGASICTDCHALPPTDTDTAHATGASPGTSRATVSFTAGFGNFGGQVGSYTGSNTETNGTTAGSCSATYCHGGKYAGVGYGAAYVGATPAPSWTGGPMTCGSCHAAPPTTHTSVGSTKNCGDCHTGYNCTSGNLAACTVASTHLNGIAESTTMNCSSCHGDAAVATRTTLGTLDTHLAAAPPKDSAGLTGTNAVGPHQKHVNPVQASQTYKPIACAECHGSAVNSYATTHSGNGVQVTFANATGANLRTYVPGQTTGNPWSCNTYCHDNPNGTGGSVASWTWNTTTTTTCGSCHGSPPPDARHVSVGTNQPATACYACHNTTVTAGGTIAFTGSGAAATTLHINGAANTAGISCHSCHGSATNDAPPTAANSANGNAVGAHQSHVTAGNIANAIACTACHTAVAPTAYNHADGSVGMNYTGQAAPFNTTVWNPATPATSNCSTSWCHGGAASQSTWGRAGGNPLWNTVNGSFQQCNSCHGNPPALNAGTHHPPNTVTACTVCHGNGYGATITAPALTSHVNGTIDYRAGCTGCHGDVTASNVASTSNLSAPGINANAIDIGGLTTGSRVGAHAAHLNGTRLRTTQLACSQCHTVPPDLTHADGAGNSTGARANVGMPGTLANGTVAGGTNTNPSFATGSCSSVYCHGARYVGRTGYTGTNMAPGWTQTQAQAATCGTCHAAAPTAGSTHNAANAGTEACSVCHTTYVNCTKSNNFATCQIPVEHINGKFDAPAGGCGMCHGNPPATISLAAGFVGATHPENPVCGNCHGAGYNTTDYASLPGSHGGTTVPGTDGPRNGCTACHGVLAGPTAAGVGVVATSAPGYNDQGVDTLGSITTSNRGVGAHDAHVRKTNFRSAALACTECHTRSTPAAGNITHANGVVPTLEFGGLGTTGGITNAQFSGTGCSMTYCHGNFTNGKDQLGTGTPTTPGQVTGLSSPTQTDRSISLSWTAVTGAVLYKIERGTSATGPWAQIGTSAGTSYVDDGLWDGSSYWYRVRAWNTAAVGDGTYSAVLAQGTTGGGGTGGTVTYNWRLNSGTTIAGMTTNWTEACGTYPTAARITTMTAAADACADRIYSTAGGPTVMVTMLAPVYAADMGISAGSFTVGLRAAAAGQYADFQLGYVTGGVFTGFGTPVQALAGNGVVTTYSGATAINLSAQTGTVLATRALALRIRKVTTGTTEMRVYLGSTNGGALSVTETPTATPPPLPSAPTGTPANPRVTAQTQDTMTVAWDPVANASTYKVERSLNGTSGWVQVAQPATTSVTDQALAASTTYYYRVKASNPGGDAASYSANASGMTAAPAPAGEISWTGAFNTGTTTLTCTSCHGSPPGGTHPANATCGTCHANYTATTVDTAVHINGVINVDCVGCHSSTQNHRDPVAGEFSLTWSHKKSAAGQTVTKWDCVVCHMEGNPADGERSSVHADGNINLRDPDTGNNIKQVVFTGARGNNTGVGSYGPVGGDPDMVFTTFRRNLTVALDNDPDAARVQAIMVNQCLKCHDVNGATAIATGQPLANLLTAGAVTRSPGKPFGTTIPGAGYNGNASESTIANGGTYNTACNTTSGTATVNGCVANVKDSFATGNSSYHPILGRNNNWFTRASRMVAPWNLAKINTTTANATEYGFLMSCWDCHATPTDSGTITRTVTAHGGTDTVRGTATVTGTPSTTNAVTLCVKCHLAYNTSGTNYSHGTGSAFSTSTGRSVKAAYLQYGCNLCHSNGYRTATVATRPVVAKNSHGVNALPNYTTGAVTLSGRWASTTAANKRPYAFIRAIDTLGDHEPRVAAGATLSAASTCDMLGSATGGPNCNQGSETLGVGGTY